MTEPLPCKHVAHDPLHEGREASFHQSCRAEVPIAEERPIAPQAAQEQAEVLERFLTGLLMDLAGRQVDNPQENLTLSDAEEAGGPIPPLRRRGIRRPRINMSQGRRGEALGDSNEATATSARSAGGRRHRGPARDAEAATVQLPPTSLPCVWAQMRLNGHEDVRLDTILKVVLRPRGP